MLISLQTASQAIFPPSIALANSPPRPSLLSIFLCPTSASSPPAALRRNFADVSSAKDRGRKNRQKKGGRTTGGIIGPQGCENTIKSFFPHFRERIAVGSFVPFYSRDQGACLVVQIWVGRRRRHARVNKCCVSSSVLPGPVTLTLHVLWGQAFSHFPFLLSPVL